MSIGTVTRGRRRIAVEFEAILADEIAREADKRSSPARRVTASDIIREAVAAFVLPANDTNGTQIETNGISSGDGSGSL